MRRADRDAVPASMPAKGRTRDAGGEVKRGRGWVSSPVGGVLAGRIRGAPARQSSSVLVVDAYNVLHTQGILPPDLAGPDVRGLIELIANSRYRRHRAVLVCDGAPSNDWFRDRPRGGPGRGASTSNERPADVAEYGWKAAIASHSFEGGSRGNAGSGSSAGAGGARGARGAGGVGGVGATRGAGGQHHVEVVFAGAGREADDAIETLLVSHSAARRMIVVSSDRRVRRAASTSGATSVSSATFLEHIAADVGAVSAGARRGHALGKRPQFALEVPLSRLDVAYWLAHMGVDDAGEPESPPPAALPSPPRKPDAGRGSDTARPATNTHAGAANSADAGTQDRGARRSGSRDRGPGATPVVVPSGETGAGAAAAGGGAGSGDRDTEWMLEARLAWTGRLNIEELDTSLWLDSPLAPDPNTARADSPGGRPFPKPPPKPGAKAASKAGANGTRPRRPQR